jgi:hypothetical protein
MRNTSIWESLVWIIIWVSILAIAILWILNVILYSTSLIDIFEKTTRLNLLKDNIQNITKRLDTSNIEENETFYIYKNPTTKYFTIYTWAINSQYKYIDELGNYIPNLASFTWETYARIFWLERDDTSITTQNQIIKASIRRLIRKVPNN